MVTLVPIGPHSLSTSHASQEKEPLADLLSSKIQGYLQTNHTPRDCINLTLQEFPDLLYQITSYSYEEFLALFPEKEHSFQTTLGIFYMTALLESPNRQKIFDLEKNIELWLPMTNQSAMHSLIEQATILLATCQDPDMDLLAQIETTLGLFIYLDPEINAWTRNLYSFAKDDDDRDWLFPNCRTYFDEFDSNLRNCTSKQQKLKEMHENLVEQFFSDDAKCLYQVGAVFLTDCLQRTLQSQDLPESLIRAITKASRKPGFEHLHFDALTRQKEIPEKFVYEVSKNYLNKDFSYLITFLIDHLDDSLLVEALKSSDRNTIILNMLNHHFPEATLISLQEWIERGFDGSSS